MSYQMIHMEIAYRLLKRVPKIKHMPTIEHEAEFILGSVAPDSVHMNEAYNIDMKVRSHMFEGCGEWSDTQDYKRWRDNIRAVLKRYVAGQEESGFRGSGVKESGLSGSGFKDFVLGLCVHCLTDYNNDIKIWRALQKEFIPPMSLPEFREPYYVEAKGIDLWLYQNSRHSKAIMELLKNAVSFDVEGLVKREDIEKQRNHLLYTQYNADRIVISGYRFLSAERIEDFIESTIDDILDFFTCVL
ncbi:MAG: hypothetical protein NC433_02865 [Clostridiales bacterium]|nr:hypothetical protein [Clostridiales bacterium]